ncbi:MAG: sodium-dependent transporter [Rhodothermales bacterium]|nr:sodium-dependent transporter [Rhodothermales bacterium]
MIFSSVFAILGAEGMARPEILSVMKDSGPASTGLTFMWTPQLFAKMAGGKLLGILFFLGLSFAAFTSLVSMIELAVRVLVDGGMARRKAVLFVASAGFVLGVPSALNLNVLGNQDFVWGVALMISGGFIAYAVLRYGLDRFRTQFVETPGDVTAGAWWSFLIRYAVPLQALVLLVWWGWQATTPGFLGEGGLWYDPFNPYSLMTCLVQWGIVAAILFAANGWMMRKTLDAAPSSATEDDPFPAALP